MASLHRLSVCVGSPLAPYAQRTAVFRIKCVERTTLGPQMQHRALDSPGSFFVRAIMFDIDGRRSSILFTDSMHARWIAIGGNVFRKNIGAEGTLPERIMENGFRS